MFVKALALNFAHNEMFPNMAKWDQEAIFPVEVTVVYFYLQSPFFVFSFLVNLFVSDFLSKKTVEEMFAYCWLTQYVL